MGVLRVVNEGNSTCVLGGKEAGRVEREREGGNEAQRRRGWWEEMLGGEKVVGRTD